MSTGQIHDLGYKRYVGTRRSVATRWTVIMHHQLSSAWKTWWRFKVWLVAAVMATAIAAGFLYLASGKVFRMIGGMGGQAIKFADGILPLSTLWYCKVGFIVSLTIGSTVVAGDLQSGAFTFYFARSLRPRDYVIGKLVGLGILLSLIMLAGPLVLAGLRLGLSDNLDQMIDLLPILYRALAIGLLGTLVYAAVPLGFSALLGNRRYAMALWAAYYIVIGWMAQGVGYVTSPAIAALDLSAALNALSLNLFELHLSGNTLAIPTSAALISILGHAALAIGVVLWRVRSAQQSGIGGSS
jgi:ABC-2 type transport system permease protein